MSWYKKASLDYATWLAEQINKMTDNHSKDMPYWFNNDKGQTKLDDWVKETRPDLSKINLSQAWNEAEWYYSSKKNNPPKSSHDPQEIQRNMNKFFAESQNVNPDAPDFAVDPRGKSKAIPSNIRKRINNAIYDLGNYHVEIPLQTIFDICKKNGVVALQEDGTPWQGMLVGGAECGSEKARNQNAKFSLAVRVDGVYVPADNLIVLNWCKMPSGKYEVVCYVS